MTQYSFIGHFKFTEYIVLIVVALVVLQFLYSTVTSIQLSSYEWQVFAKIYTISHDFCYRFLIIIVFHLLHLLKICQKMKK